MKNLGPYSLGLVVTVLLGACSQQMKQSASANSSSSSNIQSTAAEGYDQYTFEIRTWRKGSNDDFSLCHRIAKEQLVNAVGPAGSYAQLSCVDEDAYFYRLKLTAVVPKGESGIYTFDGSGVCDRELPNSGTKVAGPLDAHLAIQCGAGVQAKLAIPAGKFDMFSHDIRWFPLSDKNSLECNEVAKNQLSNLNGAAGGAVAFLKCVRNWNGFNLILDSYIPVGRPDAIYKWQGSTSCDSKVPSSGPQIVGPRGSSSSLNINCRGNEVTMIPNYADGLCRQSPFENSTITALIALNSTDGLKWTEVRGSQDLWEALQIECEYPTQIKKEFVQPGVVRFGHDPATTCTAYLMGR